MCRRAGVSGVIVKVGEGSTLLGFGLLSSLKNPLGVSDPDEGLIVSVLMLAGLVFSGFTSRAGASVFGGESEVRFQAFVGVIMENPLPKIPVVSSPEESLTELLVDFVGVIMENPLPKIPEVSSAAESRLELLVRLSELSTFLAFFGCFGASKSPSRSWLLLRIPGASSLMAVLLLSPAGLPENQDVLRRLGLVASGSPLASCGTAGTFGARLGCSKSRGISAAGDVSRSHYENHAIDCTL